MDVDTAEIEDIIDIIEENIGSSYAILVVTM